MTEHKNRQKHKEASLEKVLDCIFEKNGATIKEISETLGCTYQNVYRYVNILVEQQKILVGVRRDQSLTNSDRYVEKVAYYLET